jgi:hypothetical protein
VVADRLPRPSNGWPETTVPDTSPRDAVLARIDRERAFWRGLVREVGEDRADEPGPMGDWSFRDIASHLLGWRNRTIARLEAAAAGRPEPEPPWPANLDDDDPINDWIREEASSRSTADVLDANDQSYPRLAAAVAALPDGMITSPDVFQWLGGESVAETDPFSHLHEEHEPSIRDWLAQRG